MVDVETIDTSTTLLGRALAHPILLAPAAAHMLVHPEGEVATARGASAASAIMVLSTNSNCAVEAVAAAATQPLWFQLYVNRDRGIAKDLIQRVESAGCQALCVTVDQPVIYARDRLSRQAEALRALPLPHVPNLSRAEPRQTSAVRSRSLTWKDIEWFRSVTKLPSRPEGRHASRRRGTGGAGRRRRHHRVQSWRARARRRGGDDRRAAPCDGSRGPAHSRAHGWRHSARRRRAQGAGARRQRGPDRAPLSLRPRGERQRGRPAHRRDPAPRARRRRWRSPGRTTIAQIDRTVLWPEDR